MIEPGICLIPSNPIEINLIFCKWSFILLLLKVMRDKERKEFIVILEQYKSRLSKDKEASRKFLMDVGIVTKKGNLRQAYKHLCIPYDQD